MAERSGLNRKKRRRATMEKDDKCREYARCSAKERRDKESEICASLQEALSMICGQTIMQVDRIAMLRLAVALFRLRDYVPALMETVLEESSAANLWSENLITKCLDGFVLIFDSAGVVLYTTESVTDYLGLTQIDMVGHMLQDYINPHDYNDLRQAVTDQEAANGCGRLIVMRMKSVVGPRGRKLNLKTALMKPITFCLHTLEDKMSKRTLYLLQAAAPMCSGQGSLDSEFANRYSLNGTFVTRHSCNMKFNYVDDSVDSFLKLKPQALIGTSFYDLVHPEDLPELLKSFKELFQKTHCHTSYYRLIGASGLITWVQTEADLISRTSSGWRRQNVFCVHQIIGSQNDGELVTNRAVEDASRVAVVIPFTEHPQMQQQAVKCVDDRSVNDQITDHHQQLEEQASVRPALIGLRSDSFDEVFQWLTDDLPNDVLPDPDPTLIPDPDTTEATADFARCSLQQQQQCRKAHCTLQESKCNCSQNNIFTSCDSSFADRAALSPAEHFQTNTINGESRFGDVNAHYKMSTMPTDSYEEASDMLQTLAPFVSQEEMLPIDMKGLLNSDFDFSDWYQTEPKMHLDSPFMTYITDAFSLSSTAT